MNERLAVPSTVKGGAGNARRYALYGAGFGLAFPVVALGISLAARGLPLSLAAILALHINEPLLWIIDTAPFFLGAFASLAGARQDAVIAMNQALTQQAGDLAAAQRSLEQRVYQRTEQLEARNRQLRQAVQITRKISRIRDSEQLAQTSVETIAENFSEFLVDLYLVDERRAEVALAASSEGAHDTAGSAVRAFKVGDASLIGQVAGSGDVGRSMTGDRGPELALPLLSRGIPVGVLHMRPAHEGVALPEYTELLQLITDQLASAIETARSFREAGRAMDQLQAVTGEASKNAWRQGQPGETMVYEYTPGGTRPSRSSPAEADPSSLRVPLDLRGLRIGTIALKRKGGEPWSDDDRDLANKTAAQVALALENVRLLDETRERAQTEQMLGEFSARLNQSVNFDSLLQTAVRELAALPEVAGASVYIRPEAGPAEQGRSKSRTGE